MKLHPQFIESLQTLFSPEETELFIASLKNEKRSSLRFNTSKPYDRSSIRGEAIQWCKEGIALEERFSFTLDPLFHAGAYYVQESSSMFLEQILNSVLDDRSSGVKVLDLCAAPGGKSTHIASLIGAGNLLVSNEVIRSRAKILKENIIKWGLGNCVVTNNDPSSFSNLPDFFDVVLVDAPCSGEGMFRKSEAARSEWSPQLVQLCVERQRRILAQAWNTLAPNGYLIYSTCTFNRRENEEQVEWLESEFGGRVIVPELPSYEGVVKDECGFRFFPHITDGEGLFMALIQKADGIPVRAKKQRNTPSVGADKKILSRYIKTEGYEFPILYETIYRINAHHLNDIVRIGLKQNILYMGTEVGELLHNKLKPAHGLALSASLEQESFPRVEVSLETARDYLRKNNIDATPFQDGHNIVIYQGLPIGFVKKVGLRVNNLYPKGSRILNL